MYRNCTNYAVFVFTCCHACVAFVSYSFCICISSAGNSGSPILQLLLPLAILDLWPATPLELGGGADDGGNGEDCEDGDGGEDVDSDHAENGNSGGVADDGGGKDMN